jgi:hypothetical protein
MRDTGTSSFNRKQQDASFQNKILCHLKAGFDMPLDALKGYMLDPSIVCEFAYSSKKGKGQLPLNSQFSTIKFQNRNPVWNEQVNLCFFNEHI